MRRHFVGVMFPERALMRLPPAERARRGVIASRASIVGFLITALVACAPRDARDDKATPDSVTAPAEVAANDLTMPETWTPPPVDSTPDDPFETAVLRGLALLTHTRDSLPRYVGANLSCTSCHLEAGRRTNAAPLTGVFARYPRFIERAAAVVPIEDRVNYCFTRSLSGSRLPNDSREMQDMVAYLSHISRGVPVGGRVAAEGMPKMPPLTGDSTRGLAIFTADCARCHGADGAGVGPAPALWGPKSFSIGASMARQERAASFIRHNMPFDRPGTLTDQQAYDIAAYMVSMPRPDLPGKERDWPDGGAPSDVPYDTKGHEAARPPKLLPRAGDPRAAIVDAPASVLRR
jgi:thiosulfate dehydrogenase